MALFGVFIFYLEQTIATPMVVHFNLVTYRYKIGVINLCVIWTGHDTSLTFNVNAFKANVQTVSTLPNAVKLILRKNPWERSAADLAYVFSFIDKASPLNLILLNKEINGTA